MTDHQPDRTWRETAARSLDEQATAVDVAIAELENAHEILRDRGRDRLAGELRGAAASLRSEANELRDEATALRARTTSADQHDPPAATDLEARRHR